MRKKKTITLATWIDEIGRKEACWLLKVDSSTIRHWRLGYGLPKARQMLKIKELSGGRLTCDAMIERHFRAGK